MATALRAALWISLGGWIGALALFAFGVAPLAFTVLPGPEVAGRLVGPLLTGLNLYGIAAGLGIAALGAALGRGWLLVALPLVLVAVCGFSEFWVTAGIDEIRSQAFGPGTTSTGASQFSFLHQTSRFLYGVVAAGAVTCAVLHARAEGTSEARKLS